MKDFLRDEILRTFLYAAAALTAAALFAYLLVENLPEARDGMIAALLRGTADNMTPVIARGWFAVFLQNVRAGALFILSGTVPFLFLPWLTALLNACLIGGVLGVYARGGYDAGRVLLCGILPHGVFELPALLLCTALGLRLCLHVTRRIRRRETAAELKRFLRGCLPVLCLALLLLLIAAPVEVDITPRLLQL